MILRHPALKINHQCLLSFYRTLKTHNLNRKIIKQQLPTPDHIDPINLGRNTIKFGNSKSNHIAVSPTEFKWWSRLKPLGIFLLIQSIPLSLAAYGYKRLKDWKIDLLNTLLDNPTEIFNHCLKVIRSSDACLLLVNNNLPFVQLVDTLNPQEDISINTLIDDIKNNTDSKRNAEDNITIIFPIPTNSPLINKQNQITLVYYNKNKSSIVCLIGEVKTIDKARYWKNSWSSNITPPNFELLEVKPTIFTTSLFGCGQRDWQHYNIKRVEDKWVKVDSL